MVMQKNATYTRYHVLVCQPVYYTSTTQQRTRSTAIATVHGAMVAFACIVLYCVCKCICAYACSYLCCAVTVNAIARYVER
eukprot:10789-Heterococcus_DN1.PRE.1